MKKFFLGLLLLFLGFVAYILINTFATTSKQITVEPINKIDIEADAISRFQQALRIQTISHENVEDFDSTAFNAFNQLIINNYPLVDSLLEHQYFSEYSHLYKWEGKNPSLKPVVLMGHLDVVPIASPDKWTVDPFAGTIKDDIIWGRGTIDDKFTVIGILEATEMLLKEGFQPERTFYFSFGHDEEVSGKYGAVKIAQYMQEQGIEAEFVMDEGYAVTQKLVPGIDKDVAMIGVAEKGITSIALQVDMKGGHSSQPAKETAIDVLANAVAKLKANPLPATFSEPMEGFMDALGSEMGFVNRMAFANRAIFKSIILSTYEGAGGSGNALIRTTTSPTIFQAGIKENVIPTTARAVVNFRIIPGQTAEEVKQHVVSTINDPRVTVAFHGFNNDPSAVSPHNVEAYELINKTIKQIFPETLTAPNLVIGATDSRHFSGVSKNIYRFVPYHINEQNIDSFHGIDEHIPVEDYKDAIRFYRQLMLNTK
ncbi:M20 family peptidase [Roseivirga pacifica]|uniref:M20 family peptidase n=1 Tax=Roseivirga pacifica TaxID=1267423 RepID=UPI003BACC2C2